VAVELDVADRVAAGEGVRLPVSGSVPRLRSLRAPLLHQPAQRGDFVVEEQWS
jgi:hypothetical protein